MAFLGLRKWPTPVRVFRTCFRAGKFLIPTPLQVVKPLWPFMIAGGVTLYLVSKAQESSIRCMSHPFFLFIL